MRGLTGRQRDVLRATLASIQARHYSPSIREYMTILGLTSLRGVTGHLDALEAKGFITRTNGRVTVLRDEFGSSVTVKVESQQEAV